jgi:hypothetical protein
MTRLERIERLLGELRYEVEIGMMQGEIDEHLGFEFTVPQSKRIPDGIVFCSFRTEPMAHYYAIPRETRLKVIK